MIVWEQKCNTVLRPGFTRAVLSGSYLIADKLGQHSLNEHCRIVILVAYVPQTFRVVIAFRVYLA